MTALHVVDLPETLAELLDELSLGDNQHLDNEVIPSRGKTRELWRAGCLWLISDTTSLKWPIEGTFSRRVTIAAFSDSPDTLRFMPDALRAEDGGLFKVPSEMLRERQTYLPVLDLVIRSYFDPSEAMSRLRQAIHEAWDAAYELGPSDTTEVVDGKPAR